MLGRIQAYKAKDGFRWRFSERNTDTEEWDIVAVGTEAYGSEDEALKHGRRIIVRSWEVEVGEVVDDHACESLLRRFVRMITSLFRTR